MIPVDLNRLREATESGWTQFENHGDTMVAMPRPRFDEYHQTSRAVLDAPTVRWCAVTGTNELGPEECEGVCDPDHGCGRVALVPVKGGQE